MKQVIILILILPGFLSCKTTRNTTESNEAGKNTSFLMRAMFYNAENLFDCDNDSLTNDDDFTPTGKNYWTPTRLNAKLNNLSKVIMALGEWQAPALIGLCEIENRTVLQKLIYQTPLSRIDYRILHANSPDRRGIDVALIYQPEYFKIIDTAVIKIFIPLHPQFVTRDILYAAGQLPTGDTLHLFVNHWPSRRGGETQSEHLRMAVAATLKSKVDSLFARNKKANILIIGDFNDEPENESITNGLGTNTELSNAKTDELYNLSYHIKYSKKQFSHNFGQEWSLIDQLIVSGSLLKTNNRLFTTLASANVFKEAFMVESGAEGMGERPFRTYMGPSYKGGFSDHFPVYLDFYMNTDAIQK